MGSGLVAMVPANMIGELLSINTAVLLRAIPAQWEPLVTLGTPGQGSRVRDRGVR
jgi:hypothetical protein